MEKNGGTMILQMFLVYSILFGILMVTVYNKRWKKYYIYAKCAASMGFIVVFFLAARVCGDLWQRFWMIPAFFCCFVGDILMACYNRYHRKISFVLGLLIFLAGHIGFVCWLGTMQSLSAVDAIFPVAAVLLAGRLTLMKNMHTGRLRPFIMIYTFFVALFFAKGVRLAVVYPQVHNLVVAAGATLFMASDTSILFLYFYRKKLNWIHLFNLGTYYYGMFLLAASSMF